MKLIVLKNNVPINEVEVEVPDLEEQYEIYVGRADDCHVLIDDPLISRHHFVLKNEGADWYCEKLSQLGVILVNGTTGPKVKLGGGDEIKCGAYSVLVTELPNTRAQAPVQPATPVYEPPPQAAAPVAPAEPEPLDDLASLEDAPLEAEPLEPTEVDGEALAEGEGLEGEAPPEEENSEEGGFVGEEENAFGGGEESTDNAFGGGEEGGASLDSIPESGEGGDLIPADGEGERDEGTRVFRAFVNYQLVLFGDHAPYDRYQIDSDEVFIGRDSKKCQIVLDDPEVSSVHAVVRKKGNDVFLEDLNSSNGSILNGERINKAQVNAGDDFVIGSTTFTLEVKSDLLDVESDRLMPVEEGQVIETEEVVEEEVVGGEGEDINFTGGEGPPEKSLIARFKKDPKFRKKVIYIGAGLVFAWVMMGDDKKDIPQEDPNKKAAEAKPGDEKKDPKAKLKPQLSPEQMNRMNVAYELGISFFEQSKYFEALKEFEVVTSIDPDHKKVQSYLEETKNALKRLEEIEAQKRAEAERLEKKKKIEELLVKAREATKERKVQVAEALFGQISELDPENIEVGQLKLDLEAWQKEEERKALEEAAKIAARKKMVDSLAPGKTHYLKKEWYKAILRLEEFLRIKGTDEDLVKEGSDMLSDAKNQLASELGPLLGKARSLKEGQDYKNAYEAYLEVLKVEPTNSEALNEVDDIKAQLENRSRKIYREAIISESLSLFGDAKEKFMEVQQISPTDSEYYRKATDKLKNYME